MSGRPWLFGYLMNKTFNNLGFNSGIDLAGGRVVEDEVVFVRRLVVEPIIVAQCAGTSVSDGRRI